MTCWKFKLLAYFCAWCTIFLGAIQPPVFMLKLCLEHLTRRSRFHLYRSRKVSELCVSTRKYFLLFVNFCGRWNKTRCSRKNATMISFLSLALGLPGAYASSFTNAHLPPALSCLCNLISDNRWSSIWEPPCLLVAAKTQGRLALLGAIRAVHMI